MYEKDIELVYRQTRDPQVVEAIVLIFSSS